jgi:uncharacterized protein
VTRVASITPSRRLLVGLLVLTLSLLSLALPVTPVRALTAVFINEIHYDNVSTDVAEALEIAGPAGTDLTGWSIQLYNGANGLRYDNDALSGTIPDQQAGYGTVSLGYPVNGIQNGAPDGIALVNGSTVVQFLSYEGTFTALDGPATGLLSTDIGVFENGSEALGQSLQLTGAGTSYEQFSWTAPSAASIGAINAGQTFSLVAPVVATCGAALSAAQGYPATRTVTARDADGIVTSLSIVGITPSDPGTITIGATTPAAGVGGTASALVTVGSTTPVGSYSVQIRGTNNDATPQTGDCVLSVTVSPVLPIGTVQGAVSDVQDGLQHRSPYAPATGNGAGTTDVFVQGVVTQKFLSRTSTGANSYGLFVQNTLTTDDDNAQTSDGVFGFMGSFPDILALYGGPSYVPVVGDEIVLRARVTEFFFLTELSSMRFISLIRSGVNFDAEAPAVVANPPADLGDANRFWERGEGMRFRVEAGSVVTAPRDVFGSTLDSEFWVIAPDNDLLDREDPFTRRIFRDPHPLDDIGGTLFDNGNGARTMIQSHGLKAAAADNSVVISPARVNDVLNTDVVGALYFAFGKYGVEAGVQPSLTNGVDPSLNAPPSPAVDGEEYSTSDYNVENLYDFRDDPNDGCDFTGNPGCPGVVPPFDYVPLSLADYQLHLADLAEQIVGSLHAPDLLMIQEAEDQDICEVVAPAMVCGATDDRDGKPDTLQELALRIAAIGGPVYDTAFDRDGADDRGIVSAFMFRVDSVELLPADADDPVLGDTPTVAYPGGLTYNTDVSNPKALNADLPAGTDVSTGVDGSDVYTRAPQVGHFRIWRDGIGESVFTELWAISNHFSSTPNARVGQRTEQAAYQVAIVDAILGGDASARVISGGDFNVYPRPDDPFAPGQAYGCCSIGPSDQLGPMYDADAGLNNLWETLVADVPASAYSYVFQGQAQTLDMQWADDAQFVDLVQVRAGHFNADFPAKYAGDTARAASDHDPQVARWNTDVTLDRLHALVDYFVDTGDVAASKANLLHATLDRAETFLDRGLVDAYLSQLAAFGDQAQDLVPVHVTAGAADVLEAEADRLAGS